MCRNKTVSLVREVPEESCDLEPATVCRTANKLVPHLQPQQQCADQPRQATPATLLATWVLTLMCILIFAIFETTFLYTGV